MSSTQRVSPIHIACSPVAYPPVVGCPPLLKSVGEGYCFLFCAFFIINMRMLTASGLENGEEHYYMAHSDFEDDSFEEEDSDDYDPPPEGMTKRHTPIHHLLIYYLKHVGCNCRTCA